MSILAKYCAIKHSLSPKNDLFRYCFYGLFLLIVFMFFIVEDSQDNDNLNEKLSLDLIDIPQIVLDKDAELARARNSNCSYWDCFNVYKCGQRNGDDDRERISIYVYPIKEYVDSDQHKQAFTLTREFHTILKTIVDSPYYTPNPNDACLFVPSIDTLNQNRIDVNLVGKALASLPYWENGENHLIFNILAGQSPDYNTVLDVNTDRSLIVGAGFDSWTYRPGFDLTIPVYSPCLETYHPSQDTKRTFLLIASQLNMFPRQSRIFQEMIYDFPNDIMLLQKCPASTTKVEEALEVADKDDKEDINTNTFKDIRCSFPQGVEHEYPKVLESGIFCLVSRGVRLSQPTFLDALASGCIPVVMADNLILPFQEIIDWDLAIIKISENNMHSIVSVLKQISTERISELQKQGRFLYDRYFSSLDKIILSVLDELNDRVYPHISKNYIHWNMMKSDKAAQNPLFLPIIAQKAQGFTAVILTYDRIESLFILIQKLAVVPSLQKILVIWNNQKKAPPHCK